MEKYTQKELKRLISVGVAKLLNGNFEEISQFIHTHNIDKIGYFSGIYGINGGLIRDCDNGVLYAIPARNSTLFMIF